MQILAADQTESLLFKIDAGKQITLIANGLASGDQVVVEIVDTTRGLPATGDLCCPGPVSLPEIAGITPLRCRNGARVMMTAEHPWVVLDGPQEIYMRVRAVTSDLSAAITVDKVDTDAGGCMNCACEEPYCASYPLIDGGFGFIAGDIKDPEATVALAPCTGDVVTPTVYLFPTPRPGATAAQKDCDGAVIGYGMNRSNCAIVLNSVGNC